MAAFGLFNRERDPLAPKRTGPVWKFETPAPAPLPDPIDFAEQQRTANASAMEAQRRQRRKSTAKTGRSGTLLTDPDLLGQAPTQRATLLGI